MYNRIVKLAPILLLLSSVLAAGANHNWGYIFQNASSESISALRNMPDGGLVFTMAGTLVRTGKSGNILWQRAATNGTYFTEASVAANGNIVVAAFAIGDQADLALFCFDSDSNLLWNKLYELPERQFPFQVIALRAGWIVASNEIENAFPGKRNLVLYRLAETGDVIWTKRYPSFNPVSIAGSSDGGTIVLGRPDISIVKVSKDGTVEWARQFARPLDSPGLIQPLQDGYLIVSNKYFPGTPGSDYRGEIVLTKVNLHGEFVWHKFFKGRKSLILSDLELIPDGIVIGGARTAAHHWDHDAFLLETDRNGNLGKTITFGDENHQGVGRIKRSNEGLLTISVGESLMGTAEGRVWILRSPEADLLPFPCSSIKTSDDPINMYSTNPPRFRTFVQKITSLHPSVFNLPAILSRGKVTRSAFCSATPQE